MALAVGVNSYVTIQEADDYIESRFGYDAWAALSAEQKESALISAAQQMNAACRWYSSTYSLPGGPSYPPQLKHAQAEIAYSIAASGSASAAAANPLTRLKAGDVELEWKASGGAAMPLYSDYTKALLADVGRCSFGGGTKIVDVSRAT